MRAALIALALAALVACGRRAAPAAEGPPTPTPEAITKISENGPVKATVKVWPTAPQLGDPIHLELTIEAQPGVMVAAPFESERRIFHIAVIITFAATKAVPRLIDEEPGYNDKVGFCLFTGLFGDEPHILFIVFGVYEFCGA